MKGSALPGSQARHRLLDTVVDHLPVAVCVVSDEQLRVVLANSAFEAIAVDWDTPGSAFGAQFGAICRQVLASGTPYQLLDEAVKVHRTTAGPQEDVYFTWSFHRIELPEDEGWGVVCTAWETTGRKQVIDRLRESEERYRQLLDVSPVGVAVHVGGKLVFTNPAGAKLLGARKPEELVGKPIAEIIHPDNLVMAGARIARMMAGEQGLYPAEDRYVRLDGKEIAVEVMAVPLTFEGKPAVQVIVQDITARKRAAEELRLSRDRLAELSLRLVEAHETERRAIGRELHDQFGQMLTAMKITLDVAMQLPAEAAAKKIAQAQELASELLGRVSRLSLELRPTMLDDLGLIPALVWQVNRYQEQTGIDVVFRHNCIEGRRFATAIETAAYRIVQEALTNVARHAKATRVVLDLRATEGWLEIQIEDNGVGFDPRAAMANRRGLAGMNERALLVGGTFHIESELGQGTRKHVRIPLSGAGA